jgi:peptide/nickel transport system permease protein
MSSTTVAVSSPMQVTEHPRPSRGFLEASLLRFSRDPISMVALVGFGLIVILSYGSPWISANLLHTSPTDQDILNNLTPWFSSGHLLGTDELGRDVLTRSLYAGQVSLGIGFIVAFLSLFIGVALGLVAGYYGKWVDDSINALLQIIRGIPTLFLLITLSVLFRPDPIMLAFFFGILGWTENCRLVRGMVFSVRQRDYVDAARVLGVPDRRILVRHILPNVSSIVLVVAGFEVAGAIIGESGLSFLGLGVQPPTASWGNMLSGALNNISRAPWLVVAPGAFIFFTVLCIFLFADGLRDAMDPRLQK